MRFGVAVNNLKMYFRKVAIVATSSALMLTGLMVGPLVPTAAATTCRTTHMAMPFSDYVDGSTMWYYHNNSMIVPSPPTSYCNDINVTAINLANGSGGHCASFYVMFYSTSDVYLYSTSSVYVCATTSVVPIATSVLNGTHYIVVAGVSGGGYPTSFNYNIVD